MKVNYFSEKGNRKENEDYILSKPINNNISVHLVADGMGGYENGRLAAETVTNVIFEWLSSNDSFDDINKLINESIVKANNAIKNLSVKSGKTLGCTIGGCLIIENQASIFWVGDVKIIQIRDNKILFESEDHSLINQLKKSGNIGNNINLDSIRHIVTKSIKGDKTNFYPDIEDIKIVPNDKLVICSDGILDITKLQDFATMDFKSENLFDDLKAKCEASTDNSSLLAIEF